MVIDSPALVAITTGESIQDPLKGDPYKIGVWGPRLQRVQGSALAS